jgi:hypothetical protein
MTPEDKALAPRVAGGLAYWPSFNFEAFAASLPGPYRLRHFLQAELPCSRADADQVNLPCQGRTELLQASVQADCSQAKLLPLHGIQWQRLRPPPENRPDAIERAYTDEDNANAICG